MMRLLVVLALAAQSFCFTIPRDTDCEINLETFTGIMPVIVKGGTTEFLYPLPQSRTIKVGNNASVDLICTTIEGGVVVTAVCSAGIFEVNGNKTSVYLITCSREPIHIAKFTGKKCEKNGKEAEIGYNVSTTKFIRQIRLCFDKDAQNTLYTQYFLTKSIASQLSAKGRPFFIQDNGFYTVPSDVNTLYLRNNQQSTINQLVGLPSNSTKYINSGNSFLSRGHLTARADFFYAIQQNATFHYVNAAPQWQAVNGGNWNTMELDLRVFADTTKKDLTVYTGSYGVATLPHEQTNKETELYLYVNSTGKNGIPVPKVYWKVAYHEATKAGIALVSVNNPYINITNVGDNLICKDISSQISWLKWNATNFGLGYSYVCTVDDLRKNVTHIPDFNVTSLLK